MEPAHSLRVFFFHSTLYNTPMELFEIITFLKKNLRIIALFSLLGIALGTAIYFMLPQKYQAIGSLYIHRATEKGDGTFFTYEGYYGQQTAQTYTNTVIGLLESTSLKKDALNNLNIPVTDQSIRKLSQQIKVKKSSPQLITLTVKDTTPQKAFELWQFLSAETIETTRRLNQTGDPLMQISVVRDPVIKDEFRSLPLNLLAGLLLGTMTGVFGTALFSYGRKKK